MPGVERFDFTAAGGATGASALLPFMPLTLHREDRSTGVQGLLDTGATINVLPFRIGIELGAVWQQGGLRSDWAATWRNTKRSR